MRRNKFLSIKFFITIWAILMITGIVFFDQTDFLIIAEMLCGVVFAYFPCNVASKFIHKEENKDELEQDK